MVVRLQVCAYRGSYLRAKVVFVLRAQMLQRGAEIRLLAAQPFEQMVRADSQRWAAIAKATSARAE